MTNETGNTEPRIETRKTLMFEYKGKEHNITINQIGEEYLLTVNDGDFVLMNNTHMLALGDLIEQSI